MADHGHHDPGGHELEAINTKLLIRLMISLSLVTLLAAAAVVQWFYSQRRELEGRYAAERSFRLVDYDARMSADLEGVDKVAAAMLANPAMLEAPPPPPGWVSPDDLLGTTPAPVPVPERARPKDPAPATPGLDQPVEPLEDKDPEEVEAALEQAREAAEQGAKDEPANEPKGESAKPDKPANEPKGESDKPAKPANEPAKPAQPAKPAKPAKPTKPDEPADNG